MKYSDENHSNVNKGLRTKLNNVLTFSWTHMNYENQQLITSPEEENLNIPKLQLTRKVQQNCSSVLLKSSPLAQVRDTFSNWWFFFDWSRATWSSCDLHAQGHRLSMRVASGVKSDSCVLWDSVGDLLNTYPLCMQFEKWGHWLNFVSKQWKHRRLLFWLCKNFWNVKTTIKVILILLLL